MIIDPERMLVTREIAKEQIDNETDLGEIVIDFAILEFIEAIEVMAETLIDGCICSRMPIGSKCKPCKVMAEVFGEKLRPKSKLVLV